MRTEPTTEPLVAPTTVPTTPPTTLPATTDAPATAAGDPLLTLRGVSKGYRNSGRLTPVVQGLDLDLHRGEIICLVGPSGCGKSTLISLIAGLLVPDSGRITFDGQDVGALSDTTRARLRARRIGIVLQSGNLVPFLTAGENIALAGRLADSHTLTSTTPDTLLEQVELRGRAGHLPRRLSGGEAQRVGLAVALANSPELLLADEAVGQLDGRTARVVLHALRQACRDQGLAVLLVTHSAEVAALGSRVLRLAEGRLEEAS